MQKERQGRDGKSMKMKYVDRSEYLTLKDRGKKIENWQELILVRN